jgi:hypothetical protein
MSMAKVTQLVDRGLPNNPPATAPRNRGVGDLRNTIPPSGKAIPGDEEATIEAMEGEATDATTAGSESLPQNPATAPGSHRSNIPGNVGSLISPPGWNVP